MDGTSWAILKLLYSSCHGQRLAPLDDNIFLVYSKTIMSGCANLHVVTQLALNFKMNDYIMLLYLITQSCLGVSNH